MKLLLAIGSLFGGFITVIAWRLFRKDLKGDKPIQIFFYFYLGFFLVASLSLAVYWFVEWLKSFAS